MATKKRGNCKKYGRVKAGPRKGLCRMGPAPKKGRKKAAKKGSRRRADCEKFGFSVRLGRCRKGPVPGARRRAVDDAYSFPAAAWEQNPRPRRLDPSLNGLSGYRRR